MSNLKRFIKNNLKQTKAIFIETISNQHGHARFAIIDQNGQTLGFASHKTVKSFKYYVPPDQEDAYKAWLVMNEMKL